MKASSRRCAGGASLCVLTVRQGCASTTHTRRCAGGASLCVRPGIVTVRQACASTTTTHTHTHCWQAYFEPGSTANTHSRLHRSGTHMIMVHVL